MPLPRFAVTAGPLDAGALAGAVLAELGGASGCATTFVGVVRAENLGRRVCHLVYEAYDPLALKSFEQIEREIAEAWPGVRVAIHHRTGRLEIGEASVAIAAASAHRAEAFAACRFAIERLKQIAPIWKHEHFDGGDSWIEGATADPEDRAARAEAMRRACA
jgi:molybdopterin synthase catalytic subunit